MASGDLADARAYLCVDRFLADMPGTRALASAFELGMIDTWIRDGEHSASSLATTLRLDPHGLALLVEMLAAAGVVESGVGASGCRLTVAFRAALGYRDLLMAKLRFADLVAPDFIELSTALFVDPERFFSRARVFELFSYQHCIEVTAANLQRSARWVDITTALTRHEAGVFLAMTDLSRHRRHLDVGGNSGEFARSLCHAWPQMHSTVCDLPVVCELGRRHLRDHAEATRIDFTLAGPAGSALPQGADLVTFKSMLHDWPDDQARAFLARAQEALAPGGRVMIFERGPLRLAGRQAPYGLLPFLLFFRSYRAPEWYVEVLRVLGFADIRVEQVELEMPFVLISAGK